jgi:hypothetical protein
MAMHTVLDIGSWEREVAAAESVAVRAAVREALESGAGGASALAEVRRRLARLTPAQRALVVDGVGLAPERRR